MRGYVKLMRGRPASELMKNPSAFVLLAQIALRTRIKPIVEKGISLKRGEAWIGDYENLSLSMGQYRSAKAFLKRNGYAEFRGTKRGTIATIVDSAVYDIFNTESERAGGVGTTIKPTIKTTIRSPSETVNIQEMQKEEVDEATIKTTIKTTIRNEVSPDSTDSSEVRIKYKQNDIQKNKNINILIRKSEFQKECEELKSVTNADMVRRFFMYWSETTTDKKRMRFELEPTWETRKRLQMWIENSRVRFEQKISEKMPGQSGRSGKIETIKEILNTKKQ